LHPLAANKRKGEFAKPLLLFLYNQHHCFFN
jgi:hypothetical protein